MTAARNNGLPFDFCWVIAKCFNITGHPLQTQSLIQKPQLILCLRTATTSTLCLLPSVVARPLQSSSIVINRPNFKGK
ncbi:uncharacterized protein ANIA_11273 [Aspergillus nidulans FGSC A4]|uniref:Uncharacterized protein n=1 Tax=Emericella nidulans (strain FGSC A4 / ATCC 38163 / CBS 112.46 / NRRL 194 / M139) TaxID=227321 RepID=C8VSM3_EMENI|nr:hypothetical protein [Aspergillus nidulans FGSC A4]CBF89263.1 TPA: hypothetical protein ANIA_11273 [Aspergillus nidulans FGSC A4]